MSHSTHHNTTIKDNPIITIRARHALKRLAARATRRESKRIVFNARSIAFDESQTLTI